MFSFHILVTTVSAALLVTAPTFGQAPARVRGTITAIDDNGLAVKERDGRTFTLKTGPYTAYAYVVPSDLGAIKVNDFVGSAVKGAGELDGGGRARNNPRRHASRAN